MPSGFWILVFKLFSFTSGTRNYFKKEKRKVNFSNNHRIPGEGALKKSPETERWVIDQGDLATLGSTIIMDISITAKFGPFYIYFVIKHTIHLSLCLNNQATPKYILKSSKTLIILWMICFISGCFLHKNLLPCDYKRELVYSKQSIL